MGKNDWRFIDPALRPKRPESKYDPNYVKKEYNIGVDHKGYPIFGYNPEGKPVCYARTQNGRCMCPLRFSNGRCRMHNGQHSLKNKFTMTAFRKGLYAGKLPKALGKLLTDAIDDPEALSMKEELGVNTLQISKLLDGLQSEDDADESTWAEVKKLAEQLEKLLFDPGVQSVMAVGGAGHKIGKMADIAEKLVLRVKRGSDQHKIFEEINRAAEYRRKLIETEMKREAASRNMIPATEAVLMFKNLIGIVKRTFHKDTEGLKQLAREMDKASLDIAFRFQNNAMGAKVTPSGFIDPSSQIGDDIREAAELYDDPPKPIEVIEYSGEEELDTPYTNEPMGRGTKQHTSVSPRIMIKRKLERQQHSMGQEKGLIKNEKSVRTFKTIKFT